MKTILTTLLLASIIFASHAQQLHKVIEVDGTKKIRIEDGYSPHYKGYLLTGNFNSITTPPQNGQTIPFGNIAIWNGEAGFQSLGGGINEETTCAVSVGDTIYAGTQSGTLYRYTGVWEQLPFQSNGPLYKIAYANGKLLTIGKFTTVNGLMRQHITEYNIVTENADSVGALPSINSPLDINLEDMRMISSDDHIYFSWLNSMGMDNAWLVFDKTTGCLITPATPLPKLYDCGAITTDNNNLYLSGTDATDNQKKIWKITGTVATPLCILNGGVTAMTVKEQALYFTGTFEYVTPTGGTLQNLGKDIKFDGINFSAWSKAPENIDFMDLIATPDNEMVASTNWALYSTKASMTGIPEPITAPVIYPNPATNFIHVTGRTPVTITNLIGEKLYESDAAGIIDVSNFPNGVYSLNGKQFLIQR